MSQVQPKGVFTQKVLTGWLMDAEGKPGEKREGFDEANAFNICLQEHLRLGWEIQGDLIVTPRGNESRFNRVTVLLAHYGGDEFMGQDAHDSVPGAEVNEYDVLINGTPVLRINKDLFERQLALGKVHSESLSHIKRLHERLWYIKRTCEWAAISDIPHLARNLALSVDLIDVELQRAWGFELDIRKRTHWNSLDGCLCLRDSQGNPVYNHRCPYHEALAIEGSDG